MHYQIRRTSAFFPSEEQLWTSFYILLDCKMFGVWRSGRGRRIVKGFIFDLAAAVVGKAQNGPILHVPILKSVVESQCQVRWRLQHTKAMWKVRLSSSEVNCLNYAQLLTDIQGLQKKYQTWDGVFFRSMTYLIYCFSRDSKDLF